MRGRLGLSRAFRIILPGIVIGLLGIIIGFWVPDVGALVMLLGIFVTAVGVLVLIVVGFVTMATAGEGRPRRQDGVGGPT